MFGMMGTMGLITVLWILPAPFVIIYVLAELQGQRSGKRAPMLGTRALLGLFATASAQLVLAGLALVVAYLLDDGVGKPMMKNGVGLLLGGVLSGVLPAFFIKTRCRLDGPEGLWNKALGINAAVAGSVFVGLLTAACVALVNDDKVGAQLGAMVIYLGGSVGTLLLLTKRSPSPSK